MPRAKKGGNERRRHKKILKLAKGYKASNSRHYRIANQQVMKALTHAYRHRKERKRDFRKLWITRISAAARYHGMSYSRLMNGLKKAGVDINRKMLADLAVNDDQAFKQLVDTAKTQLQTK